MSVPLVNINPWIKLQRRSLTDLSSSERLELEESAQKWSEAMISFGFAFIHGHGISSDLIQQISTEGSEFFRKPMDEKMLYYQGHYGHPDGG
jgi:isopenicillin N synthase-like dioxygenase